MLKGQKGITLVALVVTIVVLIILAGISIALVLGDNGILTRAKEGKNIYREGQNLEASEMTNAVSWMNELDI